MYLDSIIQQGTYNNKLYALGAMESSVGLYYNKDILAEAGVEVPDADHPWTWSEFTEVSQVGDEVEFTFMPHKMHFFDKETEQVIGAE